MTGPAAGWFADPAGSDQLRWWDGTRWTEHFAPAPPVARSEHVVPPADPSTRWRFARLRLWPLWLRVVGAVVLCALLVVLAPLVTLAALVVLVTAIVAMARGSRTWLRFPSRGGAVIALVVSVVVFGVAGALTGLVYPTKSATVAEKSVPFAEVSGTATPSTPSPAPSTTIDPVDVVTSQPFTGTLATAADAGATDGRAALAVLEAIPVKEKASGAAFDRNTFGPAWIDVDHNGCDTRNDTLARDLHSPALNGSCIVTAGTLTDPYSGTRLDFRRGVGTSDLVQIDHIVSLSDAWVTGAQALTSDQRTTFANDPLNVIAVSEAARSQKAGASASEWVPSNAAFRCEYVARQVSVKATYGLWVTSAERDAMSKVLQGCASQPAVTSAYAAKPVAPPAPAEPAPAEPAPAEPAPAEPAPVEPAAPQPAPPASTYYANCSEVRAAGKAPLYAGDPGYSRKLDRDGDGIACE